MSKTLRKLLDLAPADERRRAYLLLAMIVVMAFLDMLGVASIMPFMAVLSTPQVVESNQYLQMAYQIFGFSSMQSFLLALGVAVLAMLLLSIAFKALTTYVLLRFTNMAHYTLSRRLVGAYLSQPYEWFLNRSSADIAKTVLSEVEQVTTGAILPMMQLIAHGAVVISLVGLLLFVNPLITLVIGGSIGGAYAMIYLLLRGSLGRIGVKRVKANRQRFELIQEAFGGIKDVKFGGLEGVMLDDFGAVARRFAKHRASAQIANQLPRFVLEAITFGGVLVLTLWLTTDEQNLQNVLPVLAAYVLAGYRLMPALQQVYSQLATLRNSDAALDALHADLVRLPADKAELQAPPAQAEPMGLAHSIRLQAACYHYPLAERNALDGLDIDIAAHTTVGLVGATGSGKTTVVDLILGLLTPQSGQLLVDGTPIARHNLRSWQRSIGYVSQQIFLTDDSVAANIAFGIPERLIDYAAVERAARSANLHDFVMQDLPDGYRTQVGERGVRLSGGQRQRIGIARALYHDPEVLVMDEATSALDNLTEHAVMEAVHNLGHRKTIILIAHRLSTVEECDRIFFLERGQVLASGTYAELISQCEPFRAMARAQT